MKRTYVDSNVLIAAASRKGPFVSESLDLLDDAGREFVSSIYVQIEVYPYARKHRLPVELRFFDRFFDGVAAWPADYERVSGRAIEILSRFPISTLDALHVACAMDLGTDEMVTLEGAHKGICKTKLLDVITLGDTR